MRRATAVSASAIVPLTTNLSAMQSMNHYPHIPANPLRRERLVDLAQFRRTVVTPEPSLPLAETEAQHSPEEAAGANVEEHRL
jgi:hypothetical protein